MGQTEVAATANVGWEVGVPYTHELFANSQIKNAIV